MHFFLIMMKFYIYFGIIVMLFSSGDTAVPTTTTYKTLYVDQTGRGNFTRIQAAIDNIPLKNDKWIRIHVKAGVYTEQITIPTEKPFIFLEGEGEWNTTVSWNRIDKLDEEATFMSLADNLIVKNIAFVNSYNYPPGSNNHSRIQAVAAMIKGDRCSFYGVAFSGVQDTLWDSQGRHYFLSCTIIGAVDYIFGAGQSLYERCNISVIAGASNVSPGYITAQGRSNASDSNGFVFKDCNITGNGVTFLGRAWRPYARTIFLYTYMENIINPLGWFSWNGAGHESNLIYAEYGCTGLGANNSSRVAWETKLTPASVSEYGNITFVDQEGWIANQPYHVP